MKLTKEQTANLRDFAAAKVQSGYYQTEAAILDEFKGKVYAYRLQGSDKAPAHLRLDPQTIAFWTATAKVFAKFAVAYFRRAQREVAE